MASRWHQGLISQEAGRAGPDVFCLFVFSQLQTPKTPAAAFDAVFGAVVGLLRAVASGYSEKRQKNSLGALLQFHCFVKETKKHVSRSFHITLASQPSHVA